METVTVPGDDTSANPSSVKSDESSPRQDSGRGSPPPNCAICLGTCRNKSFTDSCLHQFCFKCLLTWSKVKAECPLCKQNFKSIIHNVRSNHQYEEYMVEQRHTEQDVAESIDIANLTNRRFRYRTTLTLPRRESYAIQQLLLQYPLVADVLPAPAPRRRSPASFRRTVYRHNLWARPLPDFTGRFRDCSPDFYRYNDSQMHRLVPWLNRELHYLLNENVGHISYVMARILELLPRYHVSAPEFREAMQRYFGDRTEHFLHELYCFASTPYDMTGYDRNVQYTTDQRISTMVNEISSSDSDSVDSDIVMVSSSEPAAPGPSRPVYPGNFIPPPDTVVPIETISHSDTDDDSSDVMVVGYIKPPQERTPEVVDLIGSDSDVIVQETEAGPATSAPALPRVKLILKRHSTRPRSDSDSSYQPSPPRRRRRRRRESSESSSDVTTQSTMSRGSTSSGRTESYTPPPPRVATPPPREHSPRRSPSRRLRKAGSERDKRKKRKRSASRSRHKAKRAELDAEAERRSKKKSSSGKGVKSSKKPSEAAATEPAPAPAPEPGPSARRSRDRSETKRLRSVVNVIQKSSGESSSNSSVSSSVNIRSGASGSQTEPERTPRAPDRPDSPLDRTGLASGSPLDRPCLESGSPPYRPGLPSGSSLDRPCLASGSPPYRPGLSSGSPLDRPCLASGSPPYRPGLASGSPLDRPCLASGSPPYRPSLASSSPPYRPGFTSDSSDSEDNLPLNLSVQKTKLGL